MNGIGLNSHHLSRFHHHWFWGLREHTGAGVKTLHDMAMDLHQHPEKKEKIAFFLKRVDAYGSIIQSIFWLFNIQGYRACYYQFHSYVSWQFYEKRASMMSNPDQQKAEQAGGFMFTLNQSQQSGAISTMVWFYNGLRSYFPQLPVIIQQDNPVTAERDHMRPELPSVEHFIITKSMLTALHQLGLDRPIGDALSLAELKTAYRESLLQTHPDKTGQDSQAAFIATREAMQSIMEAVNPASCAKKSSPTSDFFADVKQRMAEMDEAIERERLVSRSIGEKAKRYCANADAYIANRDAYIAKADAYIANADAYIANADAYIAKATQYCADITELGVGVKKLGVDIQALKASEKKRFENISKAQALMAETQQMARALEVKLLAKKASQDAFLEMTQAYDAIDAYRPAHELKQHHRLFFQAVMADISRPHHPEDDALSPTL